MYGGDILNIYTLYFGVLKNFKENVPIKIVTRYAPKSLNLPASRAERVLLLAPSQNILMRYKNDNDWVSFSRDFEYELRTRHGVRELIESYINSNQDIALVCYCKDYNRCHLSLIMNYINGIAKEKGANVNHIRV